MTQHYQQAQEAKQDAKSIDRTVSMQTIFLPYYGAIIRLVWDRKNTIFYYYFISKLVQYILFIALFKKDKHSSQVEVVHSSNWYQLLGGGKYF